MKCLQIHNDYLIPGGETNSVKIIASLLEEQGVEVIRYYRNNSDMNKKGKLLFIKNGIKSFYNFEVKKDIKKIIESNHIDFVLVHNTSPLISNSIYSILYKKKIPVLKYIQNYNLLCLNGTKNKSCNICDKCIKQCNLIGVKHKCYKSNFIYTLIKYINKKTFDYLYKNKISSFITISDFVKKEHVENKFNENSIKVIHHFVENITPNYLEYENYFLYYGRISREKGIYTLINSFKESKYPLYIMGEGPDLNKIKIMVEEEQINNIIFLGYLSGSQKEEYIKKAYCTIVPSEWDEPFGRVVIESYSYGTPVIVSNRGGLPELINENKTGYIFDSGDYIALNEKIDTIHLLDKNQYIEMRKNCIKLCENQFSKEHYMKKIKQLLS